MKMPTRPFGAWWGVAAAAALLAAGASGAEFRGNLGYESRVMRHLPQNALVDARGATFKVAISRNSAPDEAQDCETGSRPINRYPLRIENSPGVTFRGGRFDGDVPLEADWEHTYCNSAGVALAQSVGARVEGVRGRRLWDGIRFSSGAHPFILEDTWLSDVRDDCVENDFLGSGIIRDVLFDGCFVGISAKVSSGQTADGSTSTVTLERVLMRLQPFPYKGNVSQGAPLKVGEAAPSFRVYDSVFALSGETPVSRSQFQTGWSKISDCGNNLLLWLSEAPFPKALGEPPSCFLVFTGAEAHALWEAARQNWIDCRPEMERFDDDPEPNSRACSRDQHG